MAELNVKNDIMSLAEAYRDYFHIGAAVSLKTIQSQSSLLAKHYNSITAENDMKFERIQPEEGVFTFEAADAIADFAMSNGMKLRGHTLVWHNQTPNWVFETASGGAASQTLLLERMKAHIDAVAGRYKGKAYAWDVVNEVIDDKSEEWLRQSKWLDGIGESFIAKAFQYAHEADPDALLFYNDYNESNPEKRDKIVKLLKSLQEQGAPIHGMGMQGHWNIYGPPIEEIRAAIESYAALDLQLHVTELDLSVFRYEDRRTDLLAPPAELMELQAQRYEEIFGLFREYKSEITSVTFWGAADDYTWLDGFPVRGRKNWPFVFDEKHEPKSSYWKIASFEK